MVLICCTFFFFGLFFFFFLNCVAPYKIFIDVNIETKKLHDSQDIFLTSDQL